MAENQKSSFVNEEDSYLSAVRKSYPSVLAGNIDHYAGILKEAAQVMREQEAIIAALIKKAKFDEDTMESILDITDQTQKDADRYFWLSHFATKEQVLDWIGYGQIAKDVLCDTEYGRMEE